MLDILLAGGSFNPIEMLYDKFEIYHYWGGSAGRETLISLNKAIGTLVPDPEHSGAYKIVDGWTQIFLITKHTIYTVLATAVVIIMMLLAKSSKLKASGAPQGMRNFIEPLLLFVRDEMVRPNVKDPHDHHDDDHGDGHGQGEHKITHRLADFYTPFITSVFLFFLAMGLIGLFPGTSTPTSALTVTGGMAILVLVIYVIHGMRLQGIFGWFKNLVPECPAALWPLMFALELAGVFIKPVALLVRLFANMTAGHCLLLSLGFLATLSLNGLGLGAGIPLAIGTTVFSFGVYLLEVLVAFIQAYIFAYLAAIFIGMYLVPEH